ncbi:MAG TPA: hypothetical protein VGN88_08555 [Phycisphaerae bacterium]
MIIQQEFVWPNMHFVPEDRLEILLSSWGFDQEPLFMLCEIEDRLQIKIEGISFMRLTLGEWVDQLVLLVRRQAHRTDAEGKSK